MHCYLHIGTEKTGTTLIQDFLCLNADKLASLDLAYLKSAGYPNNKWLVLAAFDVDRRDRWTEDRKVSNDQEMLQLQANIIKEIRIELTAKQPSTVIISSEHIQSRLTRSTEIRRLRKILVDLGFKTFSVIVYLRDPIELVSSLYSTSIKMGNKIALSPPFPTTFNYANLCNHRATIGNFSQVFTADDSRLVVRLFERTELKNSSVLDDFLRLVGINELRGFLMPKAENKSLSNLGIDLLRRVNAQIPNLNEKKSIALRARVIEKFEAYFTDDKYVMPPEVYTAYQEAFKESNEWVRQQFFSERSSLFNQRSLPRAKLDRSDTVMLDKIADLFCKAWLFDKS